MSSTNPFEVVDRVKIKRSALDLSHEYKTTQDLFQLIPISVVECIPGDVHKIGVMSVIRLQPMLAPILQSVKIRFATYFVPYRLLDDQFEKFITRNPDGDAVVSLPLFNPTDYPTPGPVTGQGSLWDFLGYPLLQPPPEACPIDYPRRAYYRIWNDFYRDENLEVEVDYLTPNDAATKILKSAWQRDLFTASLPFRQKGTSPALPIFGSAQVDWANTVVDEGSPFLGKSGMKFRYDTAAAQQYNENSMTAPERAQWLANQDQYLENVSSVSGSTFSSADIADLRLAWQIQAWLERNARGGTRYVEFLRSQFGTSPTDETLQRPVFVGGVTSDVLVSEVLQTSATSGEPTPQGSMSGHGIGVGRGFLGSYRVKEFGVLMTLATIAPTPAYQQGIDRAWLRRTTYDFPFPIFSGLSEQEVFNAEIYTRSDTDDPTGALNRTPFGYTGRYNELRYVPNKVTSEMRSTFDYWHMGRKFASAPALNAAFIRPTDAEVTELKRCFAVPSVNCIIASYGIQLQSYRPIPYMAVPANLGGL